MVALEYTDLTDTKKTSSFWLEVNSDVCFVFEVLYSWLRFLNVVMCVFLEECLMST